MKVLHSRPGNLGTIWLETAWNDGPFVFPVPPPVWLADRGRSQPLYPDWLTAHDKYC